ncbi:transposase family protein [Pirellulaceae bacterium SH449]
MLINGHLRARKYLSADSIIEGLRNRFEAMPDSRRAASVKHSLPDCLMAAFAMFSLKEPSLLAFDQRRQDQSLMNLYRIQSIPSDTQHREILDEVDPKSLNECFADIFFEVQRGGSLKDFLFHDGHYLLAIDGTGYFSSTNISCPHCLVKNRKSGKVEYSHQMVAAVLVHPSKDIVLPIAVEAIIQQDGSNKNDCERNAVRRLLMEVRRLHPKLPSGLRSYVPPTNGMDYRWRSGQTI